MNTPKHLPAAILLMGPTASGKTALAVELVRRFPCDIISVDSAMVYRGMDIGTAKPGPEILAVAPHCLLDILDPAESYSAGRFRRDARAAMAEITARGRIPLLVGGTTLYFRALQHGLADLPTADTHVRAELDACAARLGWPALHQELARVDPAAAARIHANDAQRIQRALEVFYLTGRPMSELHAAASVQDRMYRFVKLAVSPSSRAQLHTRIEQRFQAMMAAGLLAEVAALHRRGDLTRVHASMRSVGYRQFWEHLDGVCDLPTAVQRGIVATRRYAKRQMTWLHTESGVQWFDSDAPHMASDVCAHVATALSARV